MTQAYLDQMQQITLEKNVASQAPEKEKAAEVTSEEPEACPADYHARVPRVNIRRRSSSNLGKSRKGTSMKKRGARKRMNWTSNKQRPEDNGSVFARRNKRREA